jgi:hypothetical protein
VPNVVSADKVHPAGMPPAAAGKHHFVEEEKQVLRSDPQALLDYRKKLESSLTQLFPAFLRGSPVNEMFKQQMQQVIGAQLGDNEEMRSAFLPSWSPGCRRITVG